MMADVFPYGRFDVSVPEGDHQSGMAPDSRGLDTSQRPFVIVWELTQACELACKHCRADAGRGRHPDELTTAEGKGLLEEVRRFGDEQLVVLSGGDPMARNDIVELVRHGADAGLRMTLTPSGTSSLTEQRIRSLAGAGLRRMALSIDGGGPEAHDAFRGEPGSFESTMAAARWARKAELPLQINSTVCAETVGELPRIRDLVADLDAVLWSVFFLVPVGRGSALNSVTPAMSEAVMEWLADVQAAASFGIKTTEAPHYRRVVVEKGRDNDGPTEPAGDVMRRRAGIGAGDGFAFVSHVGDVYPSGFLPKSVGNVRDRSVVDLYRGADLFRSLRDPEALVGKCGACPFRGLCGGSRSRAYATTGDPLESDPLCPYVPDGYEGPLPEPSVEPS